MSYSGANEAGQARETLSEALAALQEDPNIPEDVMAVAQNIAQAVGALYEAEQASSEPDGKSCVRNALGSLSQTLALLQDVRTEHKGIQVATEVIAKAMSGLYPLTTRSSKAPPPASGGEAAPAEAPKAPAVPDAAATEPDPGGPTQPDPSAATEPDPAAAQPAPAAASGPRREVEVNIGATTESNFYVGFSGEISEGGVFLATYEVHPVGTPVSMLITLPGGFEFRAAGTVRFVRDPMDFAADADPGMGIQFDEQLGSKERDLVLRFIRKRPPMFYDE